LLSPCVVFTRVDAETVLRHDVAEGQLRQARMPAGESCRYSYSAKGGHFGITVRLATSKAILAEGIHSSAAEVFQRQVKARQASAHASKSFVAIPDLGEAAFWNGSDLWLLHGEVLALITVHPPLEGSFSNREAADKARNDLALTLSRQAAALLLPRLH